MPSGRRKNFAKLNQMEVSEYQNIFLNEDEHWWYLGHHELLLEFVSQAEKVLDLGCGTGGLTKKLPGEVFCFDISPEAVELAAKRDLPGLFLGDGASLPFADETFELVVCNGVLYTLPEEKAKKCVEEISRVLKKKGTLLIDVPALEVARGPHDKTVHTVKRFSKKELVSLISEADLNVERISYHNFYLFPLALLIRQLQRFVGAEPHSDIKKENWLKNEILLSILRLENWLIKKGINLPFGLSLFALVRKA